MLRAASVALVLAAPALVAAAACTPSTPTGKTCGVTQVSQPLLILETSEDRSTAGLARLAGGCLTESGPDPVLGQDQNLLDAHGKPFVGVNDDGTLRAVDPTTLALGQTVSVYPDFPNSSWAHGIYGVDVDPATGNLWVSRDDVPTLAVFTPHGDPAGTVDLGALDPEGHGDMNGILIQGGRAFVALGFLTHSGPGPGTISSDTARSPGVIAVIDVASRMVVGQIELHGHNPVHRLIPTDDTGQTIIVATPGQHDSIDPDDGIDLVDLDAGTAKQLISETELDGSVDEVVWAGPTEAYAIVLGPQPFVNPTSVVQFDPQTGRVTKTLAQAPWFKDMSSNDAYVHLGLALDGDVLAVGNRTQDAAGVLLFARPGGSQLPNVPVSVMPPVGLLAVPR